MLPALLQAHGTRTGSWDTQGHPLGLHRVGLPSCLSVDAQPFQASVVLSLL